MDAPRSRPADGSAAGTARAWPWLPVWLALLTWQGWLALGLFGDDPVAAVLDDRPILSGKHPQHLYLGALGAEALCRHSRTCAYDPGFQAGYPKTPIFDG